MLFTSVFLSSSEASKVRHSFAWFSIPMSSITRSLGARGRGINFKEGVEASRYQNSWQGPNSMPSLTYATP